jgi:hypothetical protein
MSLFNTIAGVVGAGGAGGGGGGGFVDPSSLLAAKHWYDTDLITNGTNNTDYAVWEDLIGTANTSSPNPPKYFSGGGTPYLEFDGVNDELNLSPEAFNDFFYVFILESVSLGADYVRIYEDGIVQIFTTGPSPTLFCYVLGNGHVFALPASPTGYMAIYFERSGTILKARLNGSELSGSGFGANPTGTTAHLGSFGASYHKNMRLRKFINGNNNLPTTDFNNLAAWVLAETGLTL